MESHIYDWLNLLIRWFHLIAGIGWIGSSFYFMWLDSALEKPKSQKPEVEGELWMVHSGGFYSVEKRYIRPGDVPPNLHWFKWEATFTWISGICLLAVVYYLSGGVFLVEGNNSILSAGQAIWASLGLIALSWFIYDLIWVSKLPDRVASVINFIFLCAVIFFVCRIFSGRAAFIHVGAIFGTIMVANVWVRILPSQQKMIDATQRGEKPDFTLGMKAKRRSVHNSYMTFPVLFLMISNHFPSTWGHPQKEIILYLMILLGGGVRHYMIERSKNKNPIWVFGPVAASLMALIIMTAPKTAQTAMAPVEGAGVRFAQVQTIIQNRCVACHSAKPTDDVFKVAPNGVMFDSYEQVKIQAARIQVRAVDTKTMPMGNKTHMPDEERGQLAAWIAQGAQP